jgi:hypothetical protein
VTRQTVRLIAACALCCSASLPAVTAAGHWRASTVLSQGKGAISHFKVSPGRIAWSYPSGNQNAQQQVLLRDDTLPGEGECVQVTLDLADFRSPNQDFAGLALSSIGVAMTNRIGLLIFHLEPDGRSLRTWHFAKRTEDPTTREEARVDLGAAEQLYLRLTCLSDREVVPSWSVDGKHFRRMRHVTFGPISAAGLYAGNARMPKGNSMAFSAYGIAEVSIEPLPPEEKPSTPSWTSPDKHLAADPAAGEFAWPQIRPEARPGAYWWWPGSAVTREDLTWNLETYHTAGFGNLGVIGIYGVKGEEDRFIDLFSPKWFEIFNHAVAEGKRLGINIDLTPSGGWRLGGPHVTKEHSEMKFSVKGGAIEARHIGAKVKRAGQGGTGLCINPYSRGAVAFHLEHLDKVFAEGKGRSPRAFYYDSFENPGNWCPEFLDEFKKCRGYDLREYAKELGGKGDPDVSRRVLCDYRETLSELLIDCVDMIVKWGEARGSTLRMQAHGAPANLLDMYAVAGIPETEVFGASKFGIPGFRRDPANIRADQQSDVVNRFSSSAAHVAGRPIVISESFTWLRNHYNTALSHIKAEADKLMLNGINCIYYHGACYSPKSTVWPGWLFYASTQANPRNSIFRDMPALNAYIARCQAVLQQGVPHNDVLLYWPAYDLWSAAGGAEKRFSVHHPEWIENTDCGKAGKWMIANGHTFDFISDRQLRDVKSEGPALRTGGATYRVVLVPAAETMPVDTVRQLVRLAEQGATILVWKTLPRKAPGLHRQAERERELGRLTQALAGIKGGRVLIGDDLSRLLTRGAVAREPLVEHGIQFIRRRNDDGVQYFLVNHSAGTVDDWVPIASRAASAVLMDPMTGQTGLAPIRRGKGGVQIHLQLVPGETRILRAFSTRKLQGPPWPIRGEAGPRLVVDGEWRVTFLEGGPTIPAAFSTRELACWTGVGDAEAERFAGAARYETMFDLPELKPGGWALDLGDVRESARVSVNGKPAGVVVAHPFRVEIGPYLREGRNELAIEVTNLSANRIRDLDIKGVNWKKFHDINFVSHLYKPFDASTWELKPSGLLGPVTLQAWE